MNKLKDSSQKYKYTAQMLVDQLDETSVFQWGRRFIKYKDETSFLGKDLDSELNLNKRFLVE